MILNQRSFTHVRCHKTRRKEKNQLSSYYIIIVKVTFQCKYFKGGGRRSPASADSLLHNEQLAALCSAKNLATSPLSGLRLRCVSTSSRSSTMAACGNAAEPPSRLPNQVVNENAPDCLLQHFCEFKTCIYFLSTLDCILSGLCFSTQLKLY